MLLRMRWFTLGFLASIGAVAYAANQVRRMRERLTPRNLARQAGRSVADALDEMAARLSPPER